MGIRVALAVGAALLASVAAGAADEAVLRDGSRHPGSLAFAEGQLRFQSADGRAPFPPADVHAYRFPLLPGSPFSAPMLTRLWLPGQQRVTGELLGLDGEQVRFRTPWAASLTVPRKAVEALTQPPGQVSLFAAPFERGLKGWRVAGTPPVGAPASPSGQPSLLLDRPGQSAEHALGTPVAAGSFGVSFRETAPVEGAHWMVESGFRGDSEAHTLRVTVAGEPGGYAVAVPGRAAPIITSGSSPGWHRLRVEFGPTALVVTVDDVALVHDRRDGPGGPLVRVRLRCVEEAGTGGARGGVAFTDFGLARAVGERRRPPGEPGQDEVWLASGDQLFGRIRHADRQGVAVAGRFGDRTLAWSEVRGLFFRQSAPPAAEGQRVRVLWRPGPGPERDELEGVVTGLDDRQLTLTHDVLGVCRIERARLREVRAEELR
jgi:hypothetical protein